MLSSPLIAVVIVAIFALGLGIGYIYSDDSKRTSVERVRTAIAIVVTVIWVVTVVAGVLIPTYTTSMFIHGIMGLVAGFFFADKGLDINIGG